MKLNILFAGESWVKYTRHIKGFDSFTTCEYEEGVKWLKSALENNGISVMHIPNHLAPTDFPNTKEEINKYNVVILSDIGSNTLLLHPKTVNNCERMPNRLLLLKDYVKNGGGLIMFGGWMSFQGIEGKANYKNTPISDILPVSLVSGDDRVEVPEGFKLNITGINHPVLEGIPREWPHFLSYNKLKPKENADVLATYNDDVIWAAQNYGDGRTMAFAVDCAPHGAPEEYLNWDYFPKIWNRAILWLAKSL